MPLTFLETSLFARIVAAQKRAIELHGATAELKKKMGGLLHRSRNVRNHSALLRAVSGVMRRSRALERGDQVTPEPEVKGVRRGPFIVVEGGCASQASGCDAKFS